MPCTASYFKMDKYTGCYIAPEYLFSNYNSIHNMGFNTSALNSQWTLTWWWRWWRWWRYPTLLNVFSFAAGLIFPHRERERGCVFPPKMSMCYLIVLFKQTCFLESFITKYDISLASLKKKHIGKRLNLN